MSTVSAAVNLSAAIIADHCDVGIGALPGHGHMG